MYFFEVLPDKYQYRLGFFSPTKQTMNALRARIDEKPEDIESLNALLTPNSGFELLGEEYKRLYASLAVQLPSTLRGWYQKKGIYVMCTCPVDPLLFRSRASAQISANSHFYARCTISFGKSGTKGT